MNAQEILNIIRDRCGLNKEYETTTRNNFGDYTMIKYPRYTIKGTPHLEHLLYVIPKDNRPVEEKGTENDYTQTVLNYYDLQKSVEQNLEDNPELRELVANLLK